LVNQLLPDAEEYFYQPYNVSYGTGESHSDKDLILYIAPLKDSVNLGFYRGVSLNDPKHLLKGIGKRLRHVKIQSMDAIHLDDIKALILEAKQERLGTIE
jgi:hypothetical protein